MNINNYRNVDFCLTYFISRNSVQQSIQFRERILKEESLSSIKENGIMAGLILMLCCGINTTLEFPEKKRILTLAICGIDKMKNRLRL